MSLGGRPPEVKKCSLIASKVILLRPSVTAAVGLDYGLAQCFHLSSAKFLLSHLPAAAGSRHVRPTLKSHIYLSEGGCLHKLFAVLHGRFAYFPHLYVYFIILIYIVFILYSGL